MSWSGFDFRGRSIDASDNVWTVWLRLLVDEIDRMDHRPPWLGEVRTHWDELAMRGLNINPALDEYITDEERRQCILTLCERALSRLRAMGDPIPKATLNALVVGPEGTTWEDDPAASLYVKPVGEFIDLIRSASLTEA